MATRTISSKQASKTKEKKSPSKKTKKSPAPRKGVVAARTNPTQRASKGKTKPKKSPAPKPVAESVSPPQAEDTNELYRVEGPTPYSGTIFDATDEIFLDEFEFEEEFVESLPFIESAVKDVTPRNHNSICNAGVSAYALFDPKSKTGWFWVTNLDVPDADFYGKVESAKSLKGALKYAYGEAKSFQEEIDANYT